MAQSRYLSVLVSYFMVNLGLTLYNKIILSMFGFRFPWALTAVHSLFSALGGIAYAFIFQVKQKRAKTSAIQVVLLFLFSVLYTVNIAVSNVSLNEVTLSFHQIVRSTTPVFTVLLSIILQGKHSPLEIYFALIPVVIGVSIATIGDVSFTTAGFLLTLFGTFLAALKGIATNALQTGEWHMDTMTLLRLMSILSFFQTIAISWLTGELNQVAVHLSQPQAAMCIVALVGNGLLAFSLNVVSFTANKETSALTMTVAANVKQVLMIILSTIVFNLEVTIVNALGIIVTLVGGAHYAWIDYKTKPPSKSNPLSPRELPTHEHLNGSESKV